MQSPHYKYKGHLDTNTVSARPFEHGVGAVPPRPDVGGEEERRRLGVLLLL